MGITIKFSDGTVAKAFAVAMCERGYSVEVDGLVWYSDSAEYTEVASNVVAENFSSRECAARVH